MVLFQLQVIARDLRLIVRGYTAVIIITAMIMIIIMMPGTAQTLEIGILIKMYKVIQRLQDTAEFADHSPKEWLKASRIIINEPRFLTRIRIVNDHVPDSGPSQKLRLVREKVRKRWTLVVGAAN